MTGLEIELKAELTAADAVLLARRLNRLAGPVSAPLKLAAVYYDTEGRRLARFTVLGHTPGRLTPCDEVHNADFPFTLDLRLS